MTQGFTTEVRDQVLIIQFNCPEIRNPLSIGVVESLAAVLGDAGTVAGLRAVIFTGADGIFASGADLREIAELKPEEAREFAFRGQNLMRIISGLSQMTIAAINGYCFGGALDLAVACDRRIGSPNASFSHPGVGLGIITGWTGTQRLPRLIGQTNALEIFLTAKRIDAMEALRIGLIDTIEDDPLSEALAVATRVIL